MCSCWHRRPGNRIVLTGLKCNVVLDIRSFFGLRRVLDVPLGIFEDGRLAIPISKLGILLLSDFD